MRRVAALSLVFALSGCGGSAPVASVPASSSVASAPAGNVTLTIVYPTNFHQIPSTSHTSSSRRAAYVNPSASNYLHVYYVLPSSAQFEATPTGGVAVNPTIGTNAQTLSVTIPAGTYTKIIASETNGGGTVLASGSVSGASATIAAGGTASLSITMSMNAQSIVLTTDPIAASDGVLLSTSSGSPTAFCTKLTTNGSIYAFPADP
jgi:hypothetical protein